jgi:hypothetical protein
MTRGHYGTRDPIGTRADVGAAAVPGIRLVQRYGGVKADVMQDLLTALARSGRGKAVKPNVWEFDFVEDNALVRTSWLPDFAGSLVVTIESTRPHIADDTPRVRQQLVRILDENIESVLLRTGATAVGAAIESSVGQPDRVATIYVDRKASWPLAQVLGAIAVVGVVLWNRHQARLIEQLYKRLDLPQQSFLASLRQDAGSLRGLAGHARPKRQGKNS